jgi:soluble lytic murein transglycosylase-like protein
MAPFRQDIILDSRQSSARPHLTWQGFIVIFRRTDYPACRIVGAFVVLAMILLFNSHPLQAGMYICRDSSGAMNFTNVRNGSDCKAFVLQKAGSWKGMANGPDSAKYDSEIRRIGRLYKVDPSLIKAIIHIESDFNHRAVSRCGAQGLMQLMPATARELRVSDPFNARENIDGGTRYFRSLLDSFNEDLVLSLAAYNAGPGLVARTGGVPKIPETQRYIKKVLKRYKVYKKAF